MIEVRNLKNTGDNLPSSKYSSWLDFWEKSKGRKAGKCSNIYCGQKASVGAHVKIANGSNDWYIVPLCNACNNYNNDDDFCIDERDLVKLN